mgnify:CR=1 FL=1
MISVILLSVFSVSAPAKPVVKASEIRRLERRIEKARSEVESLKASLKTVKEMQSDTARELALKEASFKSDFSTIISPLLSWPTISMNARVKTWIEREHGHFILDALRERLVKEPLEMIADRELNLRRADALQREIEDQVAALEAKQQFLSLQAEELKYLQKRSRTKGK